VRERLPNRAGHPANSDFRVSSPLPIDTAPAPLMQGPAHGGGSSRSPESTGGSAVRGGRPRSVLTPPGTGDIVSSRSNVSLLSDWDAFEAGGAFTQDPLTGQTHFQHLRTHMRRMKTVGTRSSNAPSLSQEGHTRDPSIDPSAVSAAGSGTVMVKALSFTSSSMLGDRDGAGSASVAPRAASTMDQLLLEGSKLVDGEGVQSVSGEVVGDDTSLSERGWAANLAGGGMAERKMAAELLLSPAGKPKASSAIQAGGVAAAAAASKPRPLADLRGPESDKSARSRGRRSGRRATAGDEVDKASERAPFTPSPLPLACSLSLQRQPLMRTDV
jgi:hypothetical protein